MLVIALSILPAIVGCGGLGAGRTINPAQKVSSSDKLWATKSLQQAHKNYTAPAR